MQIPGNINTLPSLGQNPNNNLDLSEEDNNWGKIDFERLLPILNRSLGWIILFILFSLGAAYLYLRSTRPIFESNSILKIEENKNASQLLGDIGGAYGFPQKDESRLQGELELLKSPIIYSAVAERLPLDIELNKFGKFLYVEIYRNKPFEITYEMIGDGIYDIEIDLEVLSKTEFTIKYRKGTENVSSKFKFGESYKNKQIQFAITKTKYFSEAEVGQKYFFKIQSKQAIINFLERNLSAKIGNASASTIQISFKDYSPDKAQAIVNMIDTVYKEQTLVKKNQANEQTLSFIDKQLDSTKNLLEDNERNIALFVRRTQTMQPAEAVSKIVDEIRAMEKQKAALEYRSEQIAQLKKLVDVDNEVMQFIPVLESYNDNQLTALITKLNEYSVERAAKSVQYSKEFANKSVANQAGTKKYNEAKNGVTKSIDALAGDIKGQIKNIEKEIIKFTDRFGKLPDEETNITRLRRDYNLYEKFYLLLVEKKTEFSIAKAGTTPDFQILSPASLPIVPISPQKGNVYTLWIIIGIIAGLVLIFVRYVLQDTISTVKEVERAIVTSLLGVVPAYTKERLRVAKLVTDKNPKSSLSEALRSIRTNVDFLTGIAAGKKVVLSVTSTVAGEGKTFVATNLSGILAMSGYRIVLLDLDMRKPKLNQAFDIPNERGMSMILNNKIGWKECVYRTPIQNIDVIPAGPPPPNPAELVMRPDLDNLIIELHKEYDIVFIDSPPVGLVTDGILVMQKADLAIYVVRADYSKRMYLKNINKLVKQNGFKNIAVVINGLDKLKTYGYGYGYGYDYYTDDDVPKGFDLGWFKALFGLRG